LKTISDALKAHLSQGQMTCAYLWKVKRDDGVILGFTTHDLDIAYDNGDGDGLVTYLGSTGLVNSAVAGNSDLSVDNCEAQAFLDSPSMTESDLRAGLYDESVIKVMIVNWADLGMGHLLLRQGTVGIFKLKNGIFNTELRGLAYKLTTVLGRTYGTLCRAQFGSGLNGIDTCDDSRNLNVAQYLCRVDVTLYQQNGSVASAEDNRTIVPNVGLVMRGSATPTAAAASGWFNDGLITFTSGELSGQKAEVKDWDGTTLALYLPLQFTPAPGDTFTIEPGCNKTLGDCRDKFNNVINRRAEDFIPGMDQILNYPNAS
jgi:uncharacterized phage protein (TIGR02218 family)